MGGLFATLGIAGNSLDVLQQAIGVVQNNVTNATTPGYVTQTQQLASRAFDPSEDLLGGVEASGVQSARDVYAEQSVWTASQQSGLASQQSASLNSLQQIFDVSGTSGIPGALSGLYSAFSAWSANPTDSTTQQSVLAAAQNLGTAFSQTVSQAQQINTNNGQQLTASVNQLNQDSAQVATINGEIRSNPGGANDAGLQAQLYNTLQDMSTLAPVSVHIENDGTATVLLGGQAPLVMGTTQNNVAISYPPTAATAPFPNAAPTTAKLTVAGQDVTSLVNQGSIGGEITFANTTMPSLLGNSQTQGSLNQLAQTIAQRVNTLLQGGQSSAGPPPVAGVALFTYGAVNAAGNPVSPTAVASSLGVANITGSQLAAITAAVPASAGPPAVAAQPAVANGVATELAGLVNPTNPLDMLNGFSYTQAYGNIASDIGQQASTASDNATTATDILNQATTLRANVSGVSLNDQATQLLQYQQAYQASAQMITVVNTITQSLLTASASWVNGS
jgi:flagellar hook-associated protein 1 FlgK